MNNVVCGWGRAVSIKSSSGSRLTGPGTSRAELACTIGMCKNRVCVVVHPRSSPHFARAAIILWWLSWDFSHCLATKNLGVLGIFDQSLLHPDSCTSLHWCTSNELGDSSVLVKPLKRLMWVSGTRMKESGWVLIEKARKRKKGSIAILMLAMRV